MHHAMTAIRYWLGVLTVLFICAGTASAAGQIGKTRLPVPSSGHYSGDPGGTYPMIIPPGARLVIRPRAFSVGFEEWESFTAVNWRPWGTKIARGVGSSRRCWEGGAPGCDPAVRRRVQATRPMRFFCRGGDRYYRIYTRLRVQLSPTEWSPWYRLQLGRVC